MGTFLGINSWNLESSLQSGGSQFENVSESLERFLKTKLLGPTPRVVDSLDLGLGRRICAFNKFPVMALVREPLSQPLSCVNFF